MLLELLMPHVMSGLSLTRLPSPWLEDRYGKVTKEVHFFVSLSLSLSLQPADFTLMQRLL